MEELIQCRVDRKNIRDVSVHRAPAPVDCGDGQILLRVDRFALTANNITYAAAGDSLRYWSFFPIDDPAGSANRGLPPVWGFATVIASGHDNIGRGERLYGFFPMASHVTLVPQQVSDAALVDGAAHRAGLPSFYNQYRRIPAGADQALDNEMALLQPLVATSFLLADLFDDNSWFGARQLLVASASGKTAIGLIKLVARMDQRPELVALTSARHVDFVTGLGCSDRVVSYDHIERDLVQQASVFVDMAGNADIRRRVHTHLDSHLVHSCAVGTSHWDQFAPPADLPGARPKFFFAPAQAEKRQQQWGERELRRRLGAAWRSLAMDSRQWMHVQEARGPDAVTTTWLQIANGQAAPDTGYILLP